MSRLDAILILVLVLLPALTVADSPQTWCSPCGGAAATLPDLPEGAPLLVEAVDLATATELLRPVSAEQRARTVLILPLQIRDQSLESTEPLVRKLIEGIEREGPFLGFGIEWTVRSGPMEAYALKRLSTSLQGEDLAERILISPDHLDSLESLYEAGGGPYYDALLVDDVNVEPASTWLAERDPVKRVVARVPVLHPNPLYDLAGALARGASIAFLESADRTVLEAIGALNRELSRGDFSFDPGLSIEILDSSGALRSEMAYGFVRGEDLGTLVIPPGDLTDATILRLPGTDFDNPRRVDRTGTSRITDTGTTGGRTLVGLQPRAEGFLILLDRSQLLDETIQRESVEVVSQTLLPVEEIIRNHQAHWSFQHANQPRYIARNQTDLRFAIGDGAGQIEATLAGDHFIDREGRSDWVWEDFYINGVRWKYGRVPELPLIQPEKVTQLPLDIHLTNDYRYELVRRTTLGGFDVFQIDFRPVENAPADLPLFRGTVWIDAGTWARVAISMIQLNLQGEVLSNEERVDFLPFDRADHQPLIAAEARQVSAGSMIWLPVRVEAQQVLSTAGRATAVRRSTKFSSIRIDPIDFDERHADASRSNARMVRETERGLRYLERVDGGERVVVEGFDSSRLFLVGGLHHDPGLEFPVVPLGGIDYFDFDLGGRGLQANVFFAGVIVAANLTNPSVFGTRTNAGLDMFALAIPFENTSELDGEEIEEETVKNLPITLTGRVGRPFAGFGKLDLSVALAHISYQRAETTAPSFEVPANTWVVTPSLQARYDRWGSTLSTFVELGHRTDWEPWGNPGDYREEHRDYLRYGLSLGRSFYLPKFQRIGVSVDYLDGEDLDRFSKYELGYFGPQRVRGVRSGSVRAERALFGHLSYGFVFSDQFRLEAFYDVALVDDEAAGRDRDPFHGIGIGGQTLGPWGTVLRLDIGKTVGSNAQDGFVANIVFLKLFG